MENSSRPPEAAAHEQVLAAAKIVHAGFSEEQISAITEEILQLGAMPQSYNLKEILIRHSSQAITSLSTIGQDNR